MANYVAVFRSKTDVFSFIDELSYRGVYSVTTATPKEAHVGCGLAALFPLHALRVAKQLVSSGNFPAFYGFFRAEKNGSATTVTRVF